MGDVKPDIKAPPAGEQPQHLQIKIRSQEGEQIEFKVKPTTKFEKIFAVYCEKKSVTMNTVKFLFDGQQLLAAQTVQQADLADGDAIDCVVTQVGGSRSAARQWQ